MTAIRRHPWFAFGLLLAGLVLVGEGYWLHRLRQAKQRAEARINLRMHELRSLRLVAPSPTPEVGRAIAAEVAKAEQILVELRGALRGGPAATALRQTEPPKARPDAFFALANYVQAMKTAARVHRVAVAADERFGFRAYVNEGPTVEQISTVMRQSQILRHALTALFAAQPRSLVGVWRTVPSDRRLAAPRGIEGNKDEFSMPPRFSMQMPGHVHTLGFQVEFTGVTAVLRTWLNSLAEFDLPLMVRVVEVEPVAEHSGRSVPSSAPEVGGPEGRNLAVPLVSAAASNFKVTFEYVELEPSAEGVAW